MNKLIICLIYLSISILISDLSFSQETFSYEIKTPKDERLFDAAEDEDGNYYLVGRKMSTETNITSAYFLVLDYAGNLLYENEFSDPDTMSFFSNVYYKSDSIIIFGAKGLISGGSKNQLWMLIFDKDLNILMNKTFLFEGYKISDIESIINSKGNFLLCGAVYTTATASDIFLSEISSTGDSISSAVFQFTLSQIEFDLIEKHDGGYKVFAWGPFPDAYPSNGNIVDFDSSFNYISADSVPLGLFDNHSAKWLNSTSYLLTGKKPQPNTTKTDMGIVKLDISDQIIQSAYFGKTGDTSHHVGASSNLDFISTENIYFGGTSNIFEHHLIYQPEDSWILLNNIDSNLNLNWQKFYGGDAFYYLWGIRATSDGGCLMLCTRYDDTVQDEELDIIILKVDSAGLLTSIGEGPQIPVQQLAIVPNPASEFVSIRYPDIFGYDDKEIEIYNSLGMPVFKVSATQDLTATRVDVSALPVGLYFVVLKVEGEKVAMGKLIKI
jgi:hypothetical protein